MKRSMNWQLCLRALVCLALVVLAASCGSDDDSTDSQPSDVPTGDPTGVPTGVPTGDPTGVPTGDPTGEPTGEPPVTTGGTPMDCDQCLDRVCGEAMGACLEDSDCAGILACTQECPGFAAEACGERCKQQAAGGQALFDDALACVQGECAMCLAPGDDCEICIVAECDAAVDTCFEDVDCLDYFVCFVGCENEDSGADCEARCNDAHPDGEAGFGVLFACVAAECPVCLD